MPEERLDDDESNIDIKISRSVLFLLIIMASAIVLAFLFGYYRGIEKGISLVNCTNSLLLY